MNEIDINFCAGVWPYKHGAVFSHVPIHPSELAYRWKYNIHGHIHHRERCIEDTRYYNANIDIQGTRPAHALCGLMKLWKHWTGETRLATR